MIRAINQASVMDLLSFIVSNLWIILFLFFFLTPLIHRYTLNSARRTILMRLSRRRGTQVITLIHRQETIAFLGIPISRYIDIEDSEEVLRAIRMTPPNTPIDLIIHTPGGIALAAAQIAAALKAHPGKKTVIIPHYAMSGGTLIALAADEILMDPHAVLGPIDPQIIDQNRSYSAASVLKVLEKKDVSNIDDRTLILAEEARKAMDQMKAFVEWLLSGKCGEETVKKIIEELVSGKYTHDKPIFPEEIKKLLGECVKTEIPEEVYTLMRLYKMETRPRRPGVEFVPVIPTKP